MSTRYLRKVYGENVISNENQEDTSDNDVPIINNKNPKEYNIFNLLNGDSESDTRKENDENNVVLDESYESTNHPIKSKKKRKKKKKEKLKYEDIAKEEIDEIERSIREVNKLLGEPVAVASSSGTVDDRSDEKTKENIMTIEHKYLNPQNELKKICGSKILPGDQNKSRGRGRTSLLRKTWLTTISDWFPVNKAGLSMSLDQKSNADDGIQYFVFVHSPVYRQVQEKFFAAVESQNPENIVNLLNANPYHVDAILQFADLCKLTEDLQISAEFVEKALHCLECAFHPLFNITTGNCRLSYKIQTNRALYITLFKHLMFIGGRACYRTTLELCKVLLSLDPIGDPMAIVLAIDLYALRAREYTWFIQFCKFWDNQRNLTQLPNIAYSLALAYFHTNDRETANELLQNALFMFPGVLVNLLDKCGISTDTRVLGHNYFNSKAKATTSPALEKLQDLYVVRTYHLWKEADILPWLENSVNTVMDRIDSGDEYAKFCETKRTKRYQGQPPRNILRHIILSDIKEITITHPGIQIEGAIFSYDPLPPADSIDIYSRPGTISRSPTSNSNLLSLFVSSLFMDLEGNMPNGELHRLNLPDNHDPPEEFD